MKPTSLLLLTLWLLGSGCPYQGSFPIGKKSDKPVDKEILGNWHSNAWDQEQEIEIAPQGESEYFIKITSINFDDTEHNSKFFVGTQGKFKGKNVLNLQKANSKGELMGEVFFYFKYELNNGSLTTTNLVQDQYSEKTESFSTLDEFEKYLKDHWTEEGFWGEEISWEKR